MADETGIELGLTPSSNIVVVPSTGIRYLTPVFSDWTTEQGEYQQGYKYKVYMPANDTIDKRPVIIVYSGGGTIDINDVEGTCIELVKLGYVTVAAQYKNTIGDFNSELQKQAVINSYILIKFLRDNSVRFGIKKKKIFGIGTSAGAITWIQAGITGNNTTNPYYEGKCPNIKGSLIFTASMSGAASSIYQNMIQVGGVPNQFFNGGKDLLIPVKEAQATCSKELAYGIPSFIKVYPDSDHTIGEHADIFYNPEYGIVPTFYNRLNVKQPNP